MTFPCRFPKRASAFFVLSLLSSHSPPPSIHRAGPLFLDCIAPTETGQRRRRKRRRRGHKKDGCLAIVKEKWKGEEERRKVLVRYTTVVDALMCLHLQETIKPLSSPSSYSCAEKGKCMSDCVKWMGKMNYEHGWVGWLTEPVVVFFFFRGMRS